MDIKKTLIQNFENFPSKNKFPQSPKSTKKYSSKYNCYRSVINIAQNFGHVHNKNFSLYTRQIYFIDQNCVIDQNCCNKPQLNSRWKSGVNENLFISFKTVEGKDHEGISGAHILLPSYVFALHIMVASDNKTQNCTFQFITWWKQETWAYFKKILIRFITFSWDKWNGHKSHEEAYNNFSDESWMDLQVK